ncbi:Crotonase core [Apiospora rasikravindrae]|uniref:Crotonase core n=1 Tax=Apiospora rasikravindrae TaxID=990691 RepID=A0ABR1RP84_9PEZI
MQYNTLLSTLALTTFAFAEHTVDFDDIPGVCVAPCQLTVDLSQRCDQQTNNDSDYRRCYCLAADAQQPMNKCASCIKSNTRQGDDDNDAAELMKDCGWDYAAVTTSGGTATATATVIIVSSSGGPALTTTADAASATTTASPAGAPRATAVGVGGLVAAGLAIAMM